MILSFEEYFVLNQLAYTDEMFCLDLLNNSKGIANVKLKRHTAYVILAQMQDKDLIKSKLSDNPSETTRRVYSISDYGLEVLQNCSSLHDVKSARISAEIITFIMAFVLIALAFILIVDQLIIKFTEDYVSILPCALIVVLSWCAYILLGTSKELRNSNE